MKHSPPLAPLLLALVPCPAAAGVSELVPLPVTTVAASDGAAGDQLGFAVARSGDTAIVGARLHDLPGAANAGAAYVYVRQGTGWTQQAKLVASDGRTGDQLGISVAIDGDLAVVGAWRDDPQLADSGSAYVFERIGTTWIELQRLVASDASEGDLFGRAVAIDGERILVGAMGDTNELGIEVGAVYAFERSGTFVQTGKILPEDLGVGPRHGFGRALAIDGDRAVIAAPSPSVGPSGRTYVYDHDGSGWAYTTRLSILTPAALAQPGGTTFEMAVAVEGGVVLLGTPGNAWIFEEAPETWRRTYVAFDGQPSLALGHAVAIDGGTVVIGASGSPGGSSVGSAYVLRREGERWLRVGYVPGVVEDDRFGAAIAIEGDSLVVGVPGDAAHEGGEVRFFDLEERQPRWVETDALGLEALAFERFGFAVDASGDTLLVGAPSDVFTQGIVTGRAYVLERAGLGWSAPVPLPDPVGPTPFDFGIAVAIDGEWAMAAAQGSSPGVYVYRRIGGTFQQQTVLTPGVVALLSSSSIDIDLQGDRALVGAYGNGGTAELYELGTTWTRTATFPVPADQWRGFGEAVALGEDFAFVGAPRSRPAGTGMSLDEAGVVHVYREQGGSWVLSQTLTASEPALRAHFGADLDCSGDTLAVSVGGGAYVFRRSGDQWIEEARLTRLLAGRGGDVALRGDRLAVGWPEGSGRAIGSPLPKTGAASIFERTSAGWVEIFGATPVDGESLDAYGASLAWSGDDLLVGVPDDDQPDAGQGSDERAGTVRVVAAGGGYPSFCDGADGALAACPCEAGGFDSGCDVETGFGGVRLDVVAQELAPTTRATLSGVGFSEEATPTAIVLRGVSLEASPVVFGAGVRCVAPPLARRGTAFAIGGVSTHVVGQQLSSSTAYYQLWYRRLATSSCATGGASLSNGRVVRW